MRPGLGVADRAHAVPLDLEGPVLVVARQRAGARQHRHDLVGHGLGRRVGGRVHAVDHPVLRLVVLVDREQRVAPLHALAVQADLDLARLPLEHLVGAAVPDAHRAGAVLALGDLALELEVLERVVLGVHGEAVVLGRLGQAVGDREGDEDAVALQAQVPVQARGVVLLDDEAPAVARPPPAPPSARASSAPSAWTGTSRACRSREHPSIVHPCSLPIAPRSCSSTSSRPSTTRRGAPATTPTARPTSGGCSPTGAPTAGRSSSCATTPASPTPTCTPPTPATPSSR